MEKRVRFAPSPTGQVHIGNIRTAIFNWLFARHCGGKFLLRIEDTDLERSTQVAIDALLECMNWLGLDYDEKIVYQSAMRFAHIKAAEKLIAEGKAYYGRPDDNGRQPVLFRIPWNCENISSVRSVGATEFDLHPETPVEIGSGGVDFATASKKGSPVQTSACLAGLYNMQLIDVNGKVIFELEKHSNDVFEGKNFSFSGCSKIVFTRREVFFRDLIKGELSKPLDGMKDLVIVRSDGSPVFHLANVCDDIEQNITNIVRGDDHVENTYRHILLYHALSVDPPEYAHLPMIVNSAGKPYSKRDGDAFVGDFREKGYLAEALFNYLALLGWSPGDDREKMTSSELIEAFTLERVKSAPAQLDLNKLLNLNGMYLAEMPLDKFISAITVFFQRQPWAASIDGERFKQVATLMQSRTKLFTQVETWKYFFSDDLDYDVKNLVKQLKKPENCAALEKIATEFSGTSEFSGEYIMSAITATEEAFEIAHGKLLQPLRLVVTGLPGGAELDQTLQLIGAENCAKRIKKTLEYYRKELAEQAGA